MVGRNSLSIFEYFGIIIQNVKDVFYQFKSGRWNFPHIESLQPQQERIETLVWGWRVVPALSPTPTGFSWE